MTAGVPNLDRLREEAADRFGDVLLAVGSELNRTARPDRGSARCPFGCSQGFALSYAKGRGRCHYEAKSWDAIALIQERDGCSFGDAVRRVAEILGTAPPGVPAGPPRPPASSARVRPASDVPALWKPLPTRDGIGERYLSDRRLWTGPMADVVRFNPPARSSDWDLARRANQGYRVAFAARDAAGSITNLSLRFVPRHPGEEPPEERKTVTLRGRTVRDCAFVRPGFFEIGDDPGAIADAVLFCEGGPDSLAWDLLLAESKPVTWVLGVIGAGIAGSVVRSFASHLKGRHVRLALDDDAAGEGAIPEAASAAWAAGARRVSRVTLEGAKDAAELVEKEAAHV